MALSTLIKKIESSKFKNFLNDGDIVFGIIEGDLLELMACANHDGSIDFVSFDTKKAYKLLPFVYRISLQ